jgi:hypothetical protein
MVHEEHLEDGTRRGKAAPHGPTPSDRRPKGLLMIAAAAPLETPCMWTLAFGHHEDRTPTHGCEPTREGAMAAFR